MHIAVDAMGGDNAPHAVVAGAYRAATQDGVSILLVGDREILAEELSRQGEHEDRIEIIHADEVIEMDEPAVAAVRRKKKSSIRICSELVRDGRARAMVSAGNTGAVVISAKMAIGTIAGVDRPALAAVFPNRNGRTVVLDVGANIASKPAHLRQFAVMGHSYASEVLGNPAPRIGLMSIGEEGNKGTDLTREVFKVMQTMGLNFVGNVEGRDVFQGTVEVIVCDGFVGNVILKSAESLAELLASMMREELRRTWRSLIGYGLIQPAIDRFRQRTDYREYGAAPLLGLDGGCFVAHGRSNAKAIANSIRGAVEFCEANLHIKIRDTVAELHKQEHRLLSDATTMEVPAL